MRKADVGGATYFRKGLFETTADFYAGPVEGHAAECLDSMSATSRSSYQILVETLKSHFGDQHLQQFTLTALKHHQPGTHTLQALADAVQRMARRPLVGCTEVKLEQIATAAFIGAIKDIDIQLFVRLARPTTTRAALIRAIQVQERNKASDMVSKS